MSGFTSFTTGGGGSPVNPTDGYTYLGFGADGQGTTIQGSGTIAALGTAVNLGSPLAADVSNIEIFVGHGGNTSTRNQLTILADSDVLIEDLYMLPSTSIYGWNRLKLPISAASGKQIKAQLRSGTSNGTMRVAVRTTTRVASHAPGYSKLELIAGDTTNVRADDTNVPLVSSFTSWTSLIDPTTKAYGGLVLSVGDSGVAHATGKSGLALVAVGTSGGGGESTVLQVPFGMATANPFIRPSWDLYENAVASGVRISGAALCDVPNSENVRIGIYGLVT
jgi:hypothetical protein